MLPIFEHKTVQARILAFTYEIARTLESWAQIELVIVPAELEAGITTNLQRFTRKRQAILYSVCTTS